jgi:hypothetical protein
MKMHITFHGTMDGCDVNVNVELSPLTTEEMNFVEFNLQKALIGIEEDLKNYRVVVKPAAAMSRPFEQHSKLLDDSPKGWLDDSPTLLDTRPIKFRNLA